MDLSKKLMLFLRSYSSLSSCPWPLELPIQASCEQAGYKRLTFLWYPGNHPWKKKDLNNFAYFFFYALMIGALCSLSFSHCVRLSQGGKNSKTSTSHHAQNIYSKNFLTVALSDGLGQMQQTKSSTWPILKVFFKKGSTFFQSILTHEYGQSAEIDWNFWRF